VSAARRVILRVLMLASLPMSGGTTLVEGQDTLNMAQLAKIERTWRMI
jgi:energy-converting hydrogenase Eha subunit H